MSPHHLIRRFVIKTRRKASVSRYLMRTQGDDPSSIPALLLYVWFPPARPLLSIRVRIEAFGRTADFRPQSYFDLEVWRDIFEDGDYAIELPRDPDVVFDLGAHIGLSALYYALKYPRARVYCFEAEPRNFAHLEENVRQFERVTAYNYAVCGESRRVRLHLHGRSVSHSVVERDGKGRYVEVEGHDLDTLLRLLDVERVDLIKFNIEGVEFEVLDRFSRRNEVCGYIGHFHFDLTDQHNESYLNTFVGYDVQALPTKPGRMKVHAVKRRKSP